MSVPAENSAGAAAIQPFTIPVTHPKATTSQPGKSRTSSGPGSGRVQVTALEGGRHE